MADDYNKNDLNYQHPANAQPVIVNAERAIVEVTPKRKKVAIVGFASSSRMKAPFEDPEFEIWSVNQCYRFLPRADRWFEIHNRPMFEADIVRDTDYVGWLRKCPLPVYMIERFADIPNSVRYPVEQMSREYGVDFIADLKTPVPPPTQMRFAGDRWPYLTSTPAYMIALAIAEGFEEIGVWGIDLVVGREYDYEKPCAEYLLGFARGRGIKVTLPQETALLKSRYIYGHPDPPVGGVTRTLLDSRHTKLIERRQQLATEINAVDGALQENRHWAEALNLHERGAQVIPATSTQV